MNTNQNTIQSLWIGNELSTIERLSISSFLYHGHTYHLYVYNDVQHVPSGTILKDANDILPRSQIFTYAKNGGYGGFSDWFRYALLYNQGGYWVDTDTICLKPFDLTDEFVCGLENPANVCNAVLRFPKGSSIVKQLLSLSENPNRFMPYDSPIGKVKKVQRSIRKGKPSQIAFGETGPHAVTKLLAHLGLLSHAKPFYFFYPIHPTHWQAVFDASIAYTPEIFANSYTIHLWNEFMRRSNFDKNATYSSDSLIERLKNKYLD